MKLTLLNKSNNIAQAIRRYFKFVLEIEQVEIFLLDDHYRHAERVQETEHSDFLVVDGFVGESPKGFQFGKAMEKRVLLLFYAGEIEIEEEGDFWLVLPYSLERLGDKIKELMEKPVPETEDFEKLEKRFPELKERKKHHN